MAHLASITVQRKGPYCVVRLAGEVDISNVSELRRVVGKRLLDSRDLHLVIDMSELHYLDSSGLGVLVTAHQRSRARRGSLVVVCPDGPVLRTITLTGLDRVLRLRDSLDVAIADEPGLRVFTPHLWRTVDGEPVGVLHAAAHENDTTWCGLMTADLVELTRHGYSDVRGSVRCDECDRGVEGRT